MLEENRGIEMANFSVGDSVSYVRHYGPPGKLYSQVMAGVITEMQDGWAKINLRDNQISRVHVSRL